MKHKKFSTTFFFSLFLLLAISVLVVSVWGHDHYRDGWSFVVVEEVDDDDYWDRRSHGRGRNGHRYDRWDDDDLWDRRGYDRRGEYGFGFFRFDSLDENEDGIITRKEAETLGKRIFDDYDNDDSGFLSSKEFVFHNQDKAQKYAELNYKKLTGKREIQERSKNDFIRLDENEDGQLSPEEFYMNRIKDSFEHFDRDKSGVIEKDELRRR